MLGKTHATIGTLIGFAALQPSAPEEYLIIGGFALLGSLMPDIDVDGSIISNSIISLAILGILFIYFGKIFQVFLLVALMMYSRRFKHRTFTHSILGLAVFSTAVGFLFFKGLLAFIIGYSMHLFADSLTLHGIPLFYPYNHTCYGQRVLTTGSSTEKGIGAMCILILIYVIFAI